MRQDTLNINSTALGPTAPSPKLDRVWGKEATYVISDEGVIKQNADWTHSKFTYLHNGLTVS